MRNSFEPDKILNKKLAEFKILIFTFAPLLVDKFD
jgi:hypothetical protein